MAMLVVVVLDGVHANFLTVLICVSYLLDTILILKYNLPPTCFWATTNIPLVVDTCFTTLLIAKGWIVFVPIEFAFASNTRVCVFVCLFVAEKYVWPILSPSSLSHLLSYIVCQCWDIWSCRSGSCDGCDSNALKIGYQVRWTWWSTISFHWICKCWWNGDNRLFET